MMVAEKKPLAPGLYLVATPIGNLEDITLRALSVLASADRIACEDTRQTSKLLSHFGISTPTVSYHDFNELSRATQLVEQLKQGARIAVVSDAGTPGIADPGAVLAADAMAAGIAVIPIPGANAAVNALIASGLSAEKFAFNGFLPSKEGARKTQLEALRAVLVKDESPATQIFYETPHRILEALADVIAVFGAEHRVALARELTKLHEEFVRGTAGAVLAELQARPAVRGEMVLLLDGKVAAAAQTAMTLAAEVAALVAGGASEKDALKQAAKARGLGKSEAYREWQRTKR
ncbi:MAG: 16S rRNA (cytidine(1402)-2'-O)-methyltransferase [Acidobacteriaceae bacterium]|nr:16S rRNA (cytidine(1402)-2'-O)-methyltransferase [Acidobacteriaceae bacterium]